MKTKKFHCTLLGKFAHGLGVDTEGYVLIHDSPRYKKADISQLTKWYTDGRTLSIRNAARTELNERQLSTWQNSNKD